MSCNEWHQASTSIHAIMGAQPTRPTKTKMRKGVQNHTCSLDVSCLPLLQIVRALKSSTRLPRTTRIHDRRFWGHLTLQKQTYCYCFHKWSDWWINHLPNRVISRLINHTTQMANGLWLMPYGPESGPAGPFSGHEACAMSNEPSIIIQYMDHLIYFQDYQIIFRYRFIGRHRMAELPRGSSVNGSGAANIARATNWFLIGSIHIRSLSHVSPP